MRKPLLPIRQTQVRFFQFIAVGGTGCLVQLGSLRVLEGLLPARRAWWIAYILSVATHYSLNRFWALPSARRDSGRQFLEYLAAVGIGALVQFGCFNLLYGPAGLGIMASTALAIPPSTLIVFLLLNYRVFHHNPAA